MPFLEQSDWIRLATLSRVNVVGVDVVGNLEINTEFVLLRPHFAGRGWPR